MADYTQDLIQGVSFRPKIYIAIEAGKGTFNPKTGLWTAYEQATAGAKTGNTEPAKFEIGAVQTLEINSTRDVNVWRELNYLIAGKPIESYPGLPSYELDMTRVVLYEKNYLEVFGFEGFDIIKQNRPLVVKVTMKDPTDVYTTSMMIYGVWFDSNPLNFDIDDVSDLRILQDVHAVAAGIYYPPRT
jgi:hypothetical protein